jgi:hypothetical protein
MEDIIPGFKTPVLLKRSCFICEETLNASLMDGVKLIYKLFTGGDKDNNYIVVYEDGSVSKGWR